MDLDEKIAIFMGMQEGPMGWHDDQEAFWGLPKTPKGNIYDKPLFTKDWNWVIPVVQKLTREFEDSPENLTPLRDELFDGNLEKACNEIEKLIDFLQTCSEEDINKYKKAIYNFMGITPINVGTPETPCWVASMSPWLSVSKSTEKECLDELLKSDILQTNWEIIMQVVEKVESLGFYVNSMGWACSIHKGATTYADVPKSAVSSKKESHFLALGELIHALGPKIINL